MSDENVVNVEDDGPAIEPASPPAVPPLAAAPPAEPAVPEPPPDPDESDALEIQGGQYVPLPALKAVRAENKELRGKVAEADTLRQQLAQAQGQIEGFRTIAQQLQQPRQQQQQPQAPDPRALAFAQKLDLYTQDSNGQAVPDVAKAASILGIVQEVAGQIADSRVLPMAQNSAREASIRNYQWALGVKDPQGKTLAKEIVNEVWKSMPIEATANPDIAKTLVYTAMGMERMNQQAQPPAPAGLPVVTEAVGGTPRARAVLSQLEKNVAKERGVDEASWAKHTTGFQPGRTQTLED